MRAAGKPGLAWEHRWLQEQLTQPAPSVLAPAQSEERGACGGGAFVGFQCAFTPQ